IKWLLKLSQIPQLIEVPCFSEGAQSFLQNLIDEFSVDDALEVKKIEKVTNHDVKAVEYFLKQRCQSHPEIVKVLEFFHFACTSEDINNLAHALMLKEALSKVILPVMDELIAAICNVATTNSSVPMLSRTHGQPASPTTLGKEMAIFAYRLSRERRDISQIEMLGKFAGAVGNYNAHVAAYPEIKWPQIAEELVMSLGLKFNPYVPQVCYIEKVLVIHQIRSQVRLHIVQGNLGVANGDLSHLSTKLPISRWQRDLTDSTVLRNMGVGLGHSLLAYKSALQGISKLQSSFADMQNLASVREISTDIFTY
uniref:Adenylosuccinate lyase-like n=1 Tax=Nicotiana tabacum TaxID=4097 RepID=A0A1S3Y755_TOBAC